MKNRIAPRSTGQGPAYGPLPTRVAVQQRRLTPARAEVLDELVAVGGHCTVADLSARTGQHHNTVREHLDALVEAGFVQRERAAARGRGRPAWLYAARPQEIRANGSLEYSGLARALARQILRSDQDPQEQGILAGRPWGAELAGPVHAKVALPQARSRLLELFDDLGFAPRPRNDHSDSNEPAAPSELQPSPCCLPSTESVRLTRCPMLDVARRHPDVVCWVHLGVAQGFLEALGREATATGIHPFAEPGACLLDIGPGLDRPPLPPPDAAPSP